MEFPSFSVEGRGALVTGASKGIGRHVALTLANAGADVVVSGRDETELAEVVALIRALGREATAIPAELADAEAVKRLGAEALAACPVSTFWSTTPVSACLSRPWTSRWTPGTAPSP
ncbi:MAG: hypothetical protein COY42_06585 [Armatimonadetes bacterium CG_4_10_14_0_8_um_filter_66_14]|nr:SDR family NAD(P)-dependent oxidoreductase [Armatimonadota bacterium]PIW13690.1 MAG: hypothetical protein COW34_08340 [Armatimonadetes bacterium CG17_big_fil_post_rev_8_21_14_2_50_66_6]PIZ48394.1 MAG: hypothetical protein COY42_06585 [Armatimonadetes bacterium CG_4_10_14_0_8_um_filter_66_14]PJB60491.1 MAG: hypothetical protein CO096_33740 [Armatimonadetes bacterium CG_4_9_14_3_um_filter_66_14]NCO92277.1 SDR family NAD(P)-dependent oxidoreductase [Armatimonadota bacterium]